ncbi:MAG TPA: di-heme oxidoredictase family protein [Blastocatellia bacterium]|nr:di-heme oxidoredictase family protein [Blastocatellia bacterium]
MRLLKFVVVLIFMTGLALLAYRPGLVTGQGSPTEAPAAFDDETNGFTDPATHDENRDVYAEQEFIPDGLGPVFNAQSCGECHQNPVTGAISQIVEVRAGTFNGTNFVPHPGDSLIHSRAIDPNAQEFIYDGNEVAAFRSSLNTFGDGFVEAIDSNTLATISRNQPVAMRGQVLLVPLAEAPGQFRVGRFGHKTQHASLISFAADAYLNEMGITTPFLPNENSSNGNPVTTFDNVADPEDDGGDVFIFADFMRGTKVPPRNTQLAATPDAIAGSNLFNQIGCAVCHVASITTAPAGTVINGGQFVVPPALGNKVIRPFCDFLIHDVGTGDGIAQEGMGQDTRNKLRTAPLWGLRTHNRFMHDGLSLTLNDAILRHAGEATTVVNSYRALSATAKSQLITFLRSL